MKNTVKITRHNNTVTATFLPYAAYKRASELAGEMNATIGKTAEGFFKATFKTDKTATKFCELWRAEYNANKTAPAPTPAQKPKASKGKAESQEELTTILNGVKYKLVPVFEDKPSSSKKSTQKPSTKKSTTSTKATPSKAKGKAFDYSVIKGKTNTDKNRALHAMLVGMGMKDSRTKEYQAVWTNRPWAK